MSEPKLVWTNRDYALRSGVAFASGVVSFVGKTTSASARVVALGAADGAVKWAAATDCETEGGVAVAARADAIYVSDNQKVESFDIASGTKRWSSRVITPGTADGLFASTSPIAAGGLLLYAGELFSRVVAVDAQSGAAAWCTPSAGHDKPLALWVRGDVVVSHGEDDVVASGLGDGAVRWRVALSGALGPAAVPVRDSIRLGPDLGDIVLGVDANALIAIDRATGQEKWRYHAGGAVCFAGTSEALLVADGVRTARLDTRTGAVMWQRDDRGRVVATLDARAALVVSDGEARAIAHEDGAVIDSTATRAGADVRVLASSGGRVVYADATHATMARLDGTRLALSDVADRPGVLAELLDRRLTDHVAVEAVADGPAFVVCAKSGAVSLFR